MPFKSKQQRKFMYARHPEMAEKWEAETPTGARLPRKLSKSTAKAKRTKSKE